MLILPALFLLQAAPEPPIILAKDLPSIPGPVAEYPDPAADPLERGMDMQIRRSARRGPSIPAVAFPKGSFRLEDAIKEASGRKAYRAEIPPGGTLHVRLKGLHPAWFVVKPMNKWGHLEKGMLRNVIPTGNPEATVTNPGEKPMEVFFVVDSTVVDARSEAFTLTVTAS